jgi:hypothetical protein
LSLFYAGLNASISHEEAVYYAFTDSFPVFYPAPSQQDMVICIPQKAGSLRWVDMAA